MAAEERHTTVSTGWFLHSAVQSVVCAGEMLLVARGELDLVVHDELHAALAHADRLNLTVDLADVTFMDVATITLFARSAARRLEAGRRTVLVNCSPPLRRVFSLARADHLLAP